MDIWGLWSRKKEAEVPRHARHRSPLRYTASYPFGIVTKYGFSPGDFTFLMIGETGQFVSLRIEYALRGTLIVIKG